MAFLLALDQGTTSSRAIVFDDAGSIVKIEQKEFKQHYPQPGWVEHDPEEIWESQLDVAVAVLASAGLKPADIAALGITNQRETVVLWDRTTGQPIHPAIVWQDRRTAETCQQLGAAGHLQAVREKTGLLLDPYFSGTKIAWLLDHVPQARKLAAAGKLAFWYDRYLANLEVDKRLGPRHRCHQCLSHVVDGYSQLRMGRSAARNF